MTTVQWLQPGHLILIHYWYPNCRLYSSFINHPIISFIAISIFWPVSRIAFKCQAFLASFPQERSFSFLCLSWHWHIWRSQASHFIEWPCLALSDFSSRLDSGYACVLRVLGEDVFSVSYIRRHMTATCPITGHSAYGHSVAPCLLCNVTVFSFVIKMCLMGRCIAAMQISCFSWNFHPLVPAFTGESPQSTILMGCF